MRERENERVCEHLSYIYMNSTSFRCRGRLQRHGVCLRTNGFRKDVYHDGKKKRYKSVVDMSKRVSLSCKTYPPHKSDNRVQTLTMKPTRVSFLASSNKSLPASCNPRQTLNLLSKYHIWKFTWRKCAIS